MLTTLTYHNSCFSQFESQITTFSIFSTRFMSWFGFYSVFRHPKIRILLIFLPKTIFYIEFSTISRLVPKVRVYSRKTVAFPQIPFLFKFLPSNFSSRFFFKLQFSLNAVFFSQISVKSVGSNEFPPNCHYFSTRARDSNSSNRKFLTILFRFRRSSRWKTVELINFRN